MAEIRSRLTHSDQFLRESAECRIELLDTELDLATTGGARKRQHCVGIRIWGEDRHNREPRVRMLLGLLSVAYRPLKRDDIRGLAPETFGSRLEVAEAAEDLALLIVGDGREQGYVFGHPRFADFMRDELLEEEERSAAAEKLIAYCARCPKIWTWQPERGPRICRLKV